MAKQYFGTDGIRGRVGDHPMTPDFILKLGWAAGRVLVNDSRNLVLIGKDTRISGYMLESALEAGLSAAGVNIHLLGPMPTPGIAYLTRTFRASAGVVISASHNLYVDNGVKFFSRTGIKLADEVEQAIEAEFAKPLQTVASNALGKAERIVDAAGRYIEFCKSTVPPGTTLKGVTLVLDCAHGATYHIAPQVFEELGAHVICLGADPNGFNINDACGSTAPEALQAAVLAESADLGLAIDGDGDRVIMVDDRGEVVDGDELLFIIAAAKYRNGALSGGVAGTLMSNLGLEQALARLGIAFSRAPIGDRYVLEMLHSQQWQLGGESSGHIICLDRTTTGDAIISALQVLQALVDSGRTLHEAKADMIKYPQVLINVPVDGAIDIEHSPRLQGAVQEVEQALAKQGRVLLRASGTEPLVRVMVEGQDAERVRHHAEHIAARVNEVEPVAAAGHIQN